MIILRRALSDDARPKWSMETRNIFYSDFAYSDSDRLDRIGLLWHERDWECPRGSLGVVSAMLGEGDPL